MSSFYSVEEAIMLNISSECDNSYSDSDESLLRRNDNKASKAMAVHLKKRAYEEFSHVIQEPSKVQVKKLRITKVGSSSSSTSSEEVKLDFEGRTSQQILQQLMEFSRNLPFSSDVVLHCCNVLMKRFQIEVDTVIRTKIAWLLGKLCLSINFNPLVVIEDMIKFLESEVSGKVLAQLWSSVLSIAMRTPREKALHQRLVAIACASLSDHHQEVRCKCLKVIGQLSTNKSVSQTSSERRWDKVNVHTLVADYFADPEPRVRCSSLQALVTMHQRGQRLETTVYEQACSALLDDYEQVRILAIELVWILSHIYPENLIKAPYSEEKLPLIDDAFAKICNMFNDSSYKVRTEAARLLGSMHLVSDSFLFQTLDKKLMSDLKKKKSLNEQAKEGFVEEFSTGTKWADDSPREHNPDATMLMNSGACGAFVHGLEDEMMEVRSAAVDSLTELASQRSNSNFAQAALDFLVDSLNDEIEAVRLNAVNSLHKIVGHVTLLEDQLDNVHAAMEDASREIREGIHLLLSSCRLMSKQCLYSTIMMLLKNLNKYPQDRLSIWKTQQKLGQHHSELVYLLVPQLLSCHPYFSSPEPEMDDPSYISILILVFNAAQSCPQIAQVFPEHVIRHYQYLRDSIPDLVPQQIKLTTLTSGVDSCLRLPPSVSASQSDTMTFLSRTMKRVSNLQSFDPSTQRTLLESTISDLNHVGAVATSFSSTARCSADFLQAQLLLSKAVDKNARRVSHKCSQHTSFARPAAVQIIQLTYELDHLYLGLSAEEKGLIRQLRLKAQSLLFVLEIQEMSTAKSNKFKNSNEKSQANKLCKKFFKMVEEVHSFLSGNNIAPDSFSQTLFNEFLKLSSSEKPSLVVKLLQPLLSHYSVSEVDLNNKVQRSRVTVHEPQPNFDAPITFSAGLAATIHVDVTVENVVDPLSELRMHVTYPDSTSRLFEILPNDIKKLSTLKYNVRSKVYVTHSQWSDSCAIKISFVKIHHSPEESGRSGFYGNGLLPLCKTIEVLVHPKAPSRV